MDTLAREVWTAAWGDVIMYQEGAKRIMELLRGRFAPDAADPAHQGVADFSQFKRAAWATDEYLARVDFIASHGGVRGADGRGFLGSSRVGAVFAECLPFRRSGEFGTSFC